jgi:hypothetical protein
VSHLVQEAIGFAGFGTNVIGNILLTAKSQHGWWIRIVSNGLWLTYAGVTSSFAVTANAVVFSLINVYGWWKWSREARCAALPSSGEQT